VAVSVETKDVAGFYTLTAAGIALDALAPEVVRKLPRYPVVPAALLGRLAVAENYQGKGLGGVLLGMSITDSRYCRASIVVSAFRPRRRYGRSKAGQSARRSQ
jgi:GNAT superfamily N-acetyltransferase